jgi:hypothetical protein
MQPSCRANRKTGISQVIHDVKKIFSRRVLVPSENLIFVNEGIVAQRATEEEPT